MRAIVQKRYGGLDVLSLEQVETPVPAADEVKIRIHAAGVNDWDLGLLHGTPLFMRLFLGFFKPRIKIIGCEIAGEVIAVGEEVSRFKPGDKVYCDLSSSKFGGYAEFVCLKESVPGFMPSNLSYVQAVAIPHAGLLALQSLRDFAQLREGQSVLINGAGGGMGVLALQYAKLFRCRVTAVDSQLKQEYMHLLGFDAILNYEETDFTSTGKQYDVILDTKSTRSPFDCIKALNPGGIYVTVGGSTWRILQTAVWKKWIARRHNKRVQVLGLKPNKGLDYLTGLIESGKILPAIDKRYPLEQVPDAIARFAASKHCGKVVVLVEESTEAGCAG